MTYVFLTNKLIIKVFTIVMWALLLLLHIHVALSGAWGCNVSCMNIIITRCIQCTHCTVPPKCKLPPVVLFLARRVSFLSRRVSFLSRVTEPFSMEYITREKSLHFLNILFDRKVFSLKQIVFSLVPEEVSQRAVEHFKTGL